VVLGAVEVTVGAVGGQRGHGLRAERGGDKRDADEGGEVDELLGHDSGCSVRSWNEGREGKECQGPAGGGVVEKGSCERATGRRGGINQAWA
jgi:hypothetical protein